MFAVKIGNEPVNSSKVLPTIEYLVVLAPTDLVLKRMEIDVKELALYAQPRT